MKIIECPRDAMQGLGKFIPTQDKVRYLNKLLQVGFDTLDFGSFVSHKAIPQMRDTAEVLSMIDPAGSSTALLAIIANTRGATQASSYESITYLGFPLSISETFQVKNTNRTISEALNELEEIKNICVKQDKKLVTYISMGFGNPYGDPYETTMVAQFVDILIALGTDVISLADTVGAATADQITSLLGSLARQFPHTELGVHLHSSPATATPKIKAAFESGCTRFDAALKGYGGCPMAKDELVGNIATEQLLEFLRTRNALPEYNAEAFQESLKIAGEIFPNH